MEKVNSEKVLSFNGRNDKSYTKEEAWLATEKIVYDIIHKHIGLEVNESEFMFDELLSISYLAFIKAYDKYDINKGIKFSTFLYRIVNNEILQSYRYSEDGVIKYGQRGIEISFNTPVKKDKDGKEITILETLSEENNSYDDLYGNPEDYYIKSNDNTTWEIWNKNKVTFFNKSRFFSTFFGYFFFSFFHIFISSFYISNFYPAYSILGTSNEVFNGAR